MKNMNERIKNKVADARFFITEHKTAIKNISSILGATIAGIIIHKVYDDIKYNDIRLTNGIYTADENGEQNGWYIVISPSVKELKNHDETASSTLYSFSSRETYEEFCEKTNMIKREE